QPAEQRSSVVIGPSNKPKSMKCHGLVAPLHPWLELPLLQCIDRLLIEPIHRIERLGDRHLAPRPSARTTASISTSPSMPVNLQRLVFTNLIGLDASTRRDRERRVTGRWLDPKQKDFAVRSEEKGPNRLSLNDHVRVPATVCHRCHQGRTLLAF